MLFEAAITNSQAVSLNVVLWMQFNSLHHLINEQFIEKYTLQRGEIMCLLGLLQGGLVTGTHRNLVLNPTMAALWVYATSAFLQTVGGALGLSAAAVFKSVCSDQTTFVSCTHPHTAPSRSKCLVRCQNCFSCYCRNAWHYRCSRWNADPSSNSQPGVPYIPVGKGILHSAYR